MSLPAVQPDIKDSETLAFVNELFNESRRKKREQIDRWNKYYRAFRNKTWSEYRASWMPAPSSSELFPGYHTLAAWMTDQRPTMLVSPSPNLKGLLQEDIDADIMKLKAMEMQEVLASWWINTGCGRQVEQAIFDTLNYGCGIMKTGWDQGLDRGLGNAFMRRLDPYRALPDPYGSSNDDIRYFVEVSDVPMLDIFTRFPDRANWVSPENRRDTSLQRPPDGGLHVVPMANPGATGVVGEFPGTPSANMPARYGYPGGPGPAMNPEDYTKTTTLIECWVKSTEKYVTPFIEDGQYKGDLTLEKPIWQYVAVAGGVVLTPDISNPFEHGELPYVRLPMCEIGEYWSIPMTEQILPALTALNRLAAAVQLNAELVGNPILVEDEQAGISRTKIANRPGGRLRKNQGSDVHWLEPPSVSGTIYDMISFWRETIDRTLGLSAVSRGSTMRRRESEGAVDAVQEASFVRVRSILRNMEEALRQAGRQVAANMGQFFIEPRNISRVGPTGSESYLSLGPRHFQVPTSLENGKIETIPLDFDITIQAGSSLPISRAARAAEIDSLFFMGVVDDEAVLDVHDIAQRDKIIQRVQEKKVSGQMPHAQNPRRGR